MNETNAERLQIDACLHELAGVVPSAALLGGIAARTAEDWRGAWLTRALVAAT